MSKYIINIFILIFLISCKKDKNIRDHGLESKYNDSLLKVIHTPEIEKQITRTLEKDDSLKNNRLEKEFQRYLNAKPGESLAIENIDELNEYINNRLKPKMTPGNIVAEKGNNENLDFEFSDFWRKEAFKKTREYLALHVSKNNCKLLSQSFYNPNRIKYIGGTGYLIRIICKYNCNQDYENEVIFLVHSIYLGNNQWDFFVEKQKHND